VFAVSEFNDLIEFIGQRFVLLRVNELAAFGHLMLPGLKHYG
jgi:hypothetical protein